MKKGIFLCFILVFFSIPCFAKDVTVTWEAPNPKENVEIDHYLIQIAEWLTTNKGGPYTTLNDNIPVNTLTYTATGLDDNKYYIFHVYAISTQGMPSTASNVATDQEFFFPNPAQNVTIQP